MATAHDQKYKEIVRQQKEWQTVPDENDPKTGDLYKSGCLKVQVYHEVYKGIPFGNLSSRNVVAEILSYYGNSQMVASLMQKLSHLTRAYFIREDRLGGFLSYTG